MTTTDWIELIGLPLVAVLSIITVVVRIRGLVRLQSILDESIILVPLHKSRKPMTLAIVLMVLLALLSIVGIVLNIGKVVDVIAYASLLVICVCFLVLISCMQRFRIAVTESGVLVPYRFMKWEHIHDYELGESDIYFTASKYGQPSVAYTTPRLKFSLSDYDKLKHLLDTNSNINK